MKTGQQQDGPNYCKLLLNNAKHIFVACIVEPIQQPEGGTPEGLFHEYSRIDMTTHLTQAHEHLITMKDLLGCLVLHCHAIMFSIFLPTLMCQPLSVRSTARNS